MAKVMFIEKHKDRVEIRDASGDLLVDVMVANSSRSKQVNLSFKIHNKDLKINRTKATH